MTLGETEADAGSGSSDIKGLARRGILSLGGAGVSAVVNLALIVVVSRAAGKHTAGYLFSSTSLFIVLESLCALGTATGVVYFIARRRALGEYQLVRPTLRTALGPVVVVVLLVALGSFLLAPVVGAELGGDGSTEPTQFLRVLALFLPCAVIYDVLIATTQGFHTMTPTVLLEKIGRPVLQLGFLALALAAGTAWLLPLAWVAPYLVGLMLVAVSVRRLLRGNDRRTSSQAVDQETPRPRIDRREFWTYTAPRGLAAAAQLSLQRLDIVLVALYLGAAPAAVYTAATRFVVLGQLGSQAVALAVQPKLSELMAREEIESTRRVYQTSTAWVVAVTWPVHLGVAMASPLLMRIFGSGYGDGQPVIVLLAGAMLVATGCGMVTMLLLMSGRSRENLINVFVALASNLVLNIVLIPRIGIMGAAIAWAVAIVLSNLLPLWQVHRAFGLDPFGRGTALVAALAVGCFVLPAGAAWLFSGEDAVVIGAIIAGCVAYAVGLFALRRVLELDDLMRSVKRKGASR